MSEEELELVDDVKLEVYHMNNLSEEVRERFTSDMGFVVDYLNEGSFENRRNQKIIHVEALCEMMVRLNFLRKDYESDKNTCNYFEKEVI